MYIYIYTHIQIYLLLYMNESSALRSQEKLCNFEKAIPPCHILSGCRVGMAFRCLRSGPSRVHGRYCSTLYVVYKLMWFICRYSNIVNVVCKFTTGKHHPIYILLGPSQAVTGYFLIVTLVSKSLIKVGYPRKMHLDKNSHQ